jgi:hypothetical protein
LCAFTGHMDTPGRFYIRLPPKESRLRIA